MYKIIKNSIKNIVYLFYGLWNLFKFLVLDLKKIKHAEIVCFFPFYQTGGAEKVHLHIIKALANKKVCVIFTLNSATKNFQEQFNANANCIEINPILNKRNLFVNRLLKKSICKTINNSNNCKAIFGSNAAYFYQMLPFISNKIDRIDLFHAFSKSDSREMEVVNSVMYIDKRVVINQNTKKDLLEMYTLNKVETKYNTLIQVIENGIVIENNEFIPKNNLTIKIGYVGRWSDEKRPRLFLEIAKQVRSKNSSIEFYIAGIGMKSNIDRINEASVTFLGEITNENELAAFYKQLTFLLITSEYEGFPMVIMESMAQGVIPISTNVGGISEHITNNKNGILINELDENKIVEEFCNSIFQLIENQKYRNDLSYNSFLYAQEQFSIEKFNESYQKLLSS
jgi:glycosyltransferase involved in cell wall biosynthesis